MTEEPRPGQMSRRTLLAAMAAAPFVVAMFPTKAQTAATDPAVVGQWSAPFDVGGVAIHSILLYNDDILWFQDVEGIAGTDRTSLVGTWNWRTGVTRLAPFGYNRDIFCAFHNVLPDGRVFINGGHDFTTGGKQDGQVSARPTPTIRSPAPGRAAH